MVCRDVARGGVQAAVLSVATWQLCRQLGVSARWTQRTCLALPLTHLAICAIAQDPRKDPWVLPAKSWKQTAWVIGGGTVLLAGLHLAAVPLQALVRRLQRGLPAQNAAVYLKWAFGQGGSVRRQALLNVCVWGPLAEEVVFRGFVQEDLERLSGSPCASLVLTSLAFGAVHYSARQGLSNIPIVLATTIMGLQLGAVHNEGGLVSSCWLHMAQNTFVTTRMLAFGV